MGIIETATENLAPVSGQVCEQLLESFISATSVALREMTTTEAAMRVVGRKTHPTALGDLSAVLHVGSGLEGTLVLSCRRETAASLAGRMLAGVTTELDDRIVHDCIGEIANVIAGQAKALLAGTPYHFMFTTPTVVVGAGHDLRLEPGGDCLVVAFESEVGELALQLCLKKKTG